MGRVIPISQEDAIKILNSVSEISPSTVREVLSCYQRTNKSVSSPASVFANVEVHERTGNVERVISFEKVK